MTFDVTTGSNQVDQAKAGDPSRTNRILYKQVYTLSKIGTKYAQNVAITPAVIAVINENVVKINDNIKSIDLNLNATLAIVKKNDAVIKAQHIKLKSIDVNTESIKQNEHHGKWLHENVLSLQNKLVTLGYYSEDDKVEKTTLEEQETDDTEH